MADPLISRSKRFARAAQAERERLARRRSALAKRREELQARIDSIDRELEVMDSEMVVLEGLSSQGTGSARLELATGGDGGYVLRGATIREVAVPLLMIKRGAAPIHYRDWLDLLVREGYSVAGKRPDAVFLSQVVRSPLVKSTTRAGYYEIDPKAESRLAEQLRKQKAELAQLLSDGTGDPDDPGDQRERQRALGTAMARTERELAEALRAAREWSKPAASEIRAA